MTAFDMHGFGPDSFPCFNIQAFERKMLRFYNALLRSKISLWQVAETLAGCSKDSLSYAG
jgi:hypothetical protein